MQSTGCSKRSTTTSRLGKMHWGTSRWTAIEKQRTEESKGRRRKTTTTLKKTMTMTKTRCSKRTTAKVQASDRLNSRRRQGGRLGDKIVTNLEGRARLVLDIFPPGHRAIKKAGQKESRPPLLFAAAQCRFHCTPSRQRVCPRRFRHGHWTPRRGYFPTGAPRPASSHSKTRPVLSRARSTRSKMPHHGLPSIASLEALVVGCCTGTRQAQQDPMTSSSMSLACSTRPGPRRVGYASQTSTSRRMPASGTGAATGISPSIAQTSSGPTQCERRVFRLRPSACRIPRRRHSLPPPPLQQQTERRPSSVHDCSSPPGCPTFPSTPISPFFLRFPSTSHRFVEASGTLSATRPPSSRSPTTCTARRAQRLSTAK
ncbi:hypothetical protein FA10DRAFT_304334 [Acaromyces ingoldii]|uniref:Uncharacterized protein n=1 Tax=Acaromyces ingoldii TaxID=215250 RepID=A0A316YFC1_9BASI|nr:hypothetical protein FA10DRAFT_304334 [Acaromyces ingoldii]PWN87574.1 hypothetical protein FA10DRAFT_304334 [Acaromyces ingoldii]